jgi:hypothetical protein
MRFTLQLLSAAVVILAAGFLVIMLLPNPGKALGAALAEPSRVFVPGHAPFALLHALIATIAQRIKCFESRIARLTHSQGATA